MHNQTRFQNFLRHAGPAVGLALLLAAPAPAQSPRARDLEPVDEAGLTSVLRAAKGSVVLVNFWATWCAPCRAEMPALVKLDKTLAAKGFRLLTVSADEPEQEGEAWRFIESQGARKPAYIKRAKNDEAFINSIDRGWSGALPASFLYDRSGRKVRSFIGEVKTSALEQAIRGLL